MQAATVATALRRQTALVTHRFATIGDVLQPGDWRPGRAIWCARLTADGAGARR
jgi:hypothetical protein